MTLKNPIFSVKLYFLHEFGEKSTKRLSKRQNKPKKKKPCENSTVTEI